MEMTLTLTQDLAQTILWIGVILIALEIFVFGLGFIGIIGTALTIIATISLQVDEAINLLAISHPMTWFIYVTVITAMAAIIWLVVKGQSRAVVTGNESLIGQNAIVLEWSDKKGRIHVDGETWQAISHDAVELTPDDIVQVQAVQKLTLVITAIKGN